MAPFLLPRHFSTDALRWQALLKFIFLFSPKFLDRLHHIKLNRKRFQLQKHIFWGNLSVNQAILGQIFNNFAKLDYKQPHYQNIFVKCLVEYLVVNNVYVLLPVELVFDFEKLVEKGFLVLYKHPGVFFALDFFEWFLEKFFGQIFENLD